MKIFTRAALGLSLLGVGFVLLESGCGGLAAGCPIGDDGEDDCLDGTTDCIDDETIRTCIGAGSCDAYWAERECASSERCAVVDGRAACRSPI